MNIISNYQYRNFLYGYELPEKIRADFDYVDDIDSASFIKYRGQYYSIDDFMVIQTGPNAISEFAEWHGYYSDSFFSGILIRLSDDHEQYQIATYIN